MSGREQKFDSGLDVLPEAGTRTHCHDGSYAEGLMKRHAVLAPGIVLIGVCLAFDGTAGQPRSDSVREAIDTLLATDRGPVRGLNVLPTEPRAVAIRTLEADGSPEAVDGLLRFLTTAGGDTRLRTQALVALGVVGTTEAIEALEDFAQWAEGRRAMPPPFRFGWHAYPIDHFAHTNVQPAASAAGATGRRWAIFRLPLPAFADNWWIGSSADGTNWSQPVLAGPSAEPEALVRQIAAAGSVASFVRDTDDDGLPDLTEERIGTSSRIADTDTDGVPDAQDGNPLTRPHEPSDEAEIRQRLFEALFATNDSRDVLLVVEGTGLERQQFFGYSGWVVPTAERRPGRINLTGMDVTLASPTRAQATVTDWEGMLAASGRAARLEKKHGRWVLVQFGMTWIS